MVIRLVHAYIYYAGARVAHPFHGGTGPILLDNVNCRGNESSLFQCSYTGNHNCRHIEDVAIQCGMKQTMYAGSSVLWLVEMNFGSEPQSLHCCQGYVFHGTGEKNRGYALLMKAIKPETVLFRTPTFFPLTP